MKRTASIFLKVQMILSIIMLAALVITGFVMVIVGIVDVVGGFMMDGSEVGEEVRQAAISAGGGLIGGGIGVTCAIVLPILSLVFVKIARKALEESKTREEARKGAILAIVSGAITELGFGIAAGILMLVMKDEHYAGEAAAQPQPVEEKPEVIE